MTILYDELDTAVGPLRVGVDEGGRLIRAGFVTGRPAGALRREWEGAVTDPKAPAEAVRQLREYFAGTRRVFDLPLAFDGSGFQQRVWDVLLTIPYGTTTTYGEIANDLGDATLARAVGRANATNLIPVVVPCHRVIGANQTLTGYAGGLEKKRYLLELEGVLSPQLPLG